MATLPISNTEDIIDSRDVIARIEELESTLEDCEHVDPALAAEDDVIECELWEDHEELLALKALAEEASQYAGDWEDGAALIADHYFEQFAEEEAESIGVLDRNERYQWPRNHIDWKAAAEELKHDYARVSLDGADYWIRSY